MSPTVEEMATITLSRETKRKLKAFARITELVADAMRMFAEAISSVVEAIAKMAEVLQGASRPQHSYPGVPVGFVRRGRGRVSNSVGRRR